MAPNRTTTCLADQPPRHAPQATMGRPHPLWHHTPTTTCPTIDDKHHLPSAPAHRRTIARRKSMASLASPLPPLLTSSSCDSQTPPSSPHAITT
ncbi:hypothetical protein ZWY2020_041251 [Hordeum vulgare]|nr:hypothetical protein ZWY2020_041251 [Hordeum vulgare]